MYRILIVEDDPVITETLCAYMGRWGMEARGVEDFQNVLREFVTFDPQLVLMDITLPFFDGYHWCAEIRKVSTAPILFISSAGDNLNILRALDAAAPTRSRANGPPGQSQHPARAGCGGG